MDVPELIRRTGFLRGLSLRTISTYTFVVTKFLRTYRKAPFEVTKNDIDKHCLLLLEQNSPGNTLNVHLNALKFFYEEVLGRTLTVNIRYIKTPQKIPEFLTQEETKRFLEHITNKKHFLMITLMYSAGLRVGELINLKVKDLQLDQNYGWVRGGKGNKDRIFVVAQSVKDYLTQWTHDLSPEEYIFSNNKRRMSTQTVRMVIKKALKQSNIQKNVHPHTLRHSFATHLLENGYAVTDVQPLLGHSKIETTLIYTHMAKPKLLNIISPLDNLNRTKSESIQNAP